MTIGWNWILRSLWSRKLALSTLLSCTLLSYAFSISVPLFSQIALDRIVGEQTGPFLLWLAAAAFLAILLEVVAVYFRQSAIIKMGSALEKSLSKRAFLKLMRTRLLAEGNTDERIAIFHGLNRIRNLVVQTFPAILFELGSAIASVLLILYYDVQIALFVAFAAVVSSFFLRKQLENLYVASEDQYLQEAQRSGFLAETISGFYTIKSVALESMRYRQWVDRSDRSIEALNRVGELSRDYLVGMQLAMRSVGMIVFVMSCYKLYRGSLTVGDLLAIQLLVGRVISPVLQSSDIFSQFQEVNVVIQSLKRFFSQSEDRASGPQPIRDLTDTAIAFENVGYRYPDSNNPALEGITFQLPRKGLVLIAGRNGSGKTTLLRILLGLIRDFEGSVTLGGRDLLRYQPMSLRSKISIVDQDSRLFSGTISENVTVRATMKSPTGLEDALAFSEAQTFVEKLPDGVDTVLEDSARNLSGGQRQRLAISRAIYRNASVAVFDEPATFLDPEAAVSLEKRISALAKERLVIVVSHNLAAMQEADRILVLEGGRLVGTGHHKSLLETCPPYSVIWHKHMRTTGSDPH